METHSSDMLLQRAEALAHGRVTTLHFDPFVAKRACVDGLAYLDQHAERLAAHHPGFDLQQLQALPELCDRIVAQQHTLTLLKHTRTAKHKALIAAALEWRRKLKHLARTLAATDAIDAATLTRLLSGFGHRNYASDVLDLLDLLAPHEALVERVFGPGAFEKASSTATAALEAIGVAAKDTEAIRAAVSRRDRYATLVEQGHERLRVAVASLSSLRESMAIVAPLSTGARRRRTREPIKPPPPAP